MYSSTLFLHPLQLKNEGIKKIKRQQQVQQNRQQKETKQKEKESQEKNPPTTKFPPQSIKLHLSHDKNEREGKKPGCLQFLLFLDTPEAL